MVKHCTCSSGSKGSGSALFTFESVQFIKILHKQFDKTFFMRNSVEHDILNAHKYKNIKKFSFFSDSDKPRMLFFLLINVKMPTTVGILTFISRKNFMLNCVEHEKSVYNLGAKVASDLKVHFKHIYTCTNFFRPCQF